jgi:hypothetical protein
MRQGDSQRVPAPRSSIPRTATGSTNQRTPSRQRHPVGRINPIAPAYAALYPAAEPAGTEDNYFTNQLRPYDYNAVLGRIDHNFNSATRLFVTATGTSARRTATTGPGREQRDGEGAINGFEVTQGFDYRSNTGVTMGFTSTPSEHAALRPRRQLVEVRRVARPGADVRPATLGFSSHGRAAWRLQYLPSSRSAASAPQPELAHRSLGAQRSDWGEASAARSQLSLAPTVDLAGARTRCAPATSCAAALGHHDAPTAPGRYHFNGAYTRANNSAPHNDAGPVVGPVPARPAHHRHQHRGAHAARPASSRSRPRRLPQVSHGLFLQDDWRSRRS